MGPEWTIRRMKQRGIPRQRTKLSLLTPWLTYPFLVRCLVSVYTSHRDLKPPRPSFPPLPLSSPLSIHPCDRLSTPPTRSGSRLVYQHGHPLPSSNLYLVKPFLAYLTAHAHSIHHTLFPLSLVTAPRSLPHTLCVPATSLSSDYTLTSVYRTTSDPAQRNSKPRPGLKNAPKSPPPVLGG